MSSDIIVWGSSVSVFTGNILIFVRATYDIKVFALFWDSEINTGKKEEKIESLTAAGKHSKKTNNRSKHY